MIILETERLVLREIDPNRDAEFMLEILNEPAFIEHVADRGVRTAEQATEFIRQRILPSYAEHGFGFYVMELKETGMAVGMCGLVKRETMEDVDIGYSTLRAYWGKGYAFEAASALMEHGRTVHRLPRIVGVTGVNNHASAKLLEKLGLRYVRMVQLPGYSDEGRLFA
ncbi:MAG: GNAT family N-acetyltransferase [Chthoniobacterales bacterium]|nr:GNAT family N-acetyltransferase [Chthoniobacterales bacterium]